jgi:hypothetical protein
MNTTKYSEQIKGDKRNYNWPVRFDMTTGGFLGISQLEGLDTVRDRVLLSPNQVKELVAFIKSHQRHR